MAQHNATLGQIDIEDGQDRRVRGDSGAAQISGSSPLVLGQLQGGHMDLHSHTSASMAI